MKNSTLKQHNKKLLTTAILSAALFTQPQAAPLPNGILLGIEQGVGSGTNVSCTNGSCFGMEVAPGLVIWADFGPGTDSGIIVGKNQRASGQETSPSPTNNTACEISNAWYFFANYGCFHTPAGSTNVFDDASCAGASCIGVTELNSWNVAWNANDVPMGSADGCNSPSCSADQLAGIFFTDYTMAASGNSSYSMNYGNVVPDGDPSSFGNVKFSLILKGTVTYVYTTPTPTPTPPTPPPPTPICDTAISNGPVVAEGQAGKLIPWKPDILAFGLSTCSIHTAPPSGTATVTEDCSSGSFIADQPGIYTFYYDSDVRSDSGCYVLFDTGPGIVTVTVNESSTPIAKDLSITNTSGATTEVSTGYAAWAGTCGIESQPLNGVAVMGDLCSSILYTSNDGYIGSDSFQYFLQDKLGKYIGNVSVSVSPAACRDQYPSRSITSLGAGQSEAANSTMSTTFKGHIVTNDDKGKVTICPGTTIDYVVTSTVGTAKCSLHHETVDPTGTLTAGDKLVCTNKPDGKDTDKFKIKRSKSKDIAVERKWFR